MLGINNNIDVDDFYCGFDQNKVKRVKISKIMKKLKIYKNCKNFKNRKNLSILITLKNC